MASRPRVTLNKLLLDELALTDVLIFRIKTHYDMCKNEFQSTDPEMYHMKQALDDMYVVYPSRGVMDINTAHPAAAAILNLSNNYLMSNQYRMEHDGEEDRPRRELRYVTDARGNLGIKYDEVESRSVARYF